MTKSAIKTLLNGIKALIPNPQVQSDYAENNSNSISYIKNRPFYKDEETEEIKQIGEEFIPPISAENVYLDEDLSTDYDGAQTVEEGFRKVVSMIDSIDITEELDVLREEFDEKIDKFDEKIEEFDEKIEGLSNQIGGDYTVLKDAINGYHYIIQMRGGKLVSFCRCASIQITKKPDKLVYLEGEIFDPTGMIIEAVAEDGTVFEINQYAYDDSPLVIDQQVKIVYTEMSKDFEAMVEITVVPFNPEVVLVDFEYIANNDGTYTITDWKGTYNGVESTKLIIPNNGLIVV